MEERATQTKAEVKQRSARRDLRNVTALLFGGPFLYFALMTAVTLLTGRLRTGILALATVIMLVRVVRRPPGTPIAAYVKDGCMGCLPWLLRYAVVALGALATNGTFWGEDIRLEAATVPLAALALWLVIGVPDRAFQIGLDPDGAGNARAALIGVLVWAAAALNAACIVILLHSFAKGVLTITVVFTIAFTVPLYRSMAAASWEHGAAGTFSPKRTITRWRKMLPELQAARDAAAKPDIWQPDQKAVPASPDKGGLDANDGPQDGDGRLMDDPDAPPQPEAVPEARP